MAYCRSLAPDLVTCVISALHLLYHHLCGCTDGPRVSWHALMPARDRSAPSPYHEGFSRDDPHMEAGRMQNMTQSFWF